MENHSQQHKACNKVTPPQTPLPPKSPPPDILNTTGVSLATVSNIDIDIQSREEERNAPITYVPQTAMSNARPDNDTARQCQRPAEERRQGGKQDPSPPLPLPPPRRLVSNVGSRGGEEKPSNGPLTQCIRSQTAPKSRLRASAEEQTMAGDADDTMELLKDVVIESPALELRRVSDVSKSLSESRPAGELKVGSIGQTCEVNMDNNNDTMNLLMEVPTQNHTEDVRVSIAHACRWRMIIPCHDLH